MILLYDFGGVLVDLDKERCIRAFSALGFDMRRLIGTYAQSGVLSRLETGAISVPEFCEEVRRLIVAADASAPAPSDDAIIAAWQAYLVDVPAERLDLLLRARRHYRLCLLSNTNPIHWAQGSEGFFRYKGHTVDDFFDRVFLSYELGVEKPAPLIFEKVVEALGVPPEEILFFDDSEENCLAARRCGLRARLAPAGGRWLDYFDADGRLLNATAAADCP